MGIKNTMPNPESIYLDELSFSTACRLLWRREPKNVIVLDAIRNIQKLWRWMIKLKGYNVAEASFFAGHLKTEEGESIYLSARRMSGNMALLAAKNIVQSDPTLNSINDLYGRNTIRLFIARQLQLYVEHYVVRIMVAQSLCRPDPVVLWMNKPTIFNKALLAEVLQGVEICFYSTAKFELILLAKSWFFDVVRDKKLILGLGRRRRSSKQAKTRKPSLLLLQEDNIRADCSLRGQPHWVDTNNPSLLFDTYVVELLNSSCSTAGDESQLSNAGVQILSTSVFRTAVQAMRNNKTLVKVRKDRRNAIRSVFHATEFPSQYFLLRVANLLRQAELMGALALWLNFHEFLIRETQYSFSDALQLVASELNITTLAYQYSNLGFYSPLMMSTADKLLIFSDMYKAIYQADGIAPKEFLTVGYLYDGVACLVRERAYKHRAALSRAGAKFIVCYFDESVQHDRWGLVSKGDHLGELHALINTIISDPTFGVVVKSQFINNSPSRLYPEDELLQAAKATGRYLELIEGVHRNDIYPTEAALIADLCIGHKFGATAALEAATAGVRTVLLDTYGTKTLWDAIYAKAAIEYESIDLLMAALARYRAGNAAEQTIGDWTPILQYFDPYRDGKAIERLRQEILVNI